MLTPWDSVDTPLQIHNPGKYTAAVTSMLSAVSRDWPNQKLATAIVTLLVCITADRLPDATVWKHALHALLSLREPWA